MIAIDTNLLVYAHRSDDVRHAVARNCVRQLVEGDRPWGLPWPCVHEFLAVVTHAATKPKPTPIGVALAQLRAWTESPRCELLGEGEGYLDTLEGLLRASGATGGRVHDARIAAICILREVSEIWTADRDFTRFPGLRVVNPLVA